MQIIEDINKHNEIKKVKVKTKSKVHLHDNKYLVAEQWYDVNDVPYILNYSYFA